jgi:predicted secreted protein
MASNPLSNSARRASLASAALTMALALPTAAFAQSAPPPRPELPQLSLEAAASSDVAQDKVTITMGSDYDGVDQAKVSDQLNKLLASTLATAKRNAKVESRSGSYRVWANTDKTGKIIGWRGRAEIILESKDFVAASTLAGELSKSMAVSNIDFSLSREAREAEEQRLLVEAAKAFRARASSASQAFGFGGYNVRQLDLSGSGTVYQTRPMMAMRAASAEAKFSDSVPMEAGKATVTVSVRGTVELLSGK